jgi:starch synthase (maltosyl-transferring)
VLERRVIIENVRPVVDGGRFPIKRTPGETVAVRANIFADGHDVLVAVITDWHVGSDAPRESRMELASPGDDQWTGAFDVAEVGWHTYALVAWVDRYETWRRDLRIKADAGQDVSVELLEGALLVREAAARAEQIGSGHDDAHWLLTHADALADAAPIDARVRLGVSDELAVLMRTYADRSRASTSPAYRIWVDRHRARTGAWYEMFPRSAGPDPTRSATLREAAARLPAIADLGFDVVYLPPIHPIGRSFRKGRNNSLAAQPGDPGSPWAIGSEDGGHTAIEPGLGTFADFEAFRAEAERLDMEVALDLAWQSSPDHPWVREHPEWFRHRPDGSIKYAENPPKKYQDIYPLDFENDDARALWQELLEVTLFWIERGVRIFRVDNPHTKTLGFWEWLIDEVHARDPRIIFLSEAFTRPAVMRYLAKAGFTQSYTYFTWRNTKRELIDYFTELTTGDAREYLRPNLFANTPDILHEYLQHGGRPAFMTRLLLAATLGANYGIYSGFELCENRPVRPGSEEYLDSEKYQYRHWDWDRPGNIKELVARVNQIRRHEPALQFDHTLAFHETDNPQIIAFSKTAGDSAVFVVVNLDPQYMQHGFVRFPFAPDAARAYKVLDLVDEVVYTWRGEWNYVRFDPEVRQGHILKLEFEDLRI